MVVEKTGIHSFIGEAAHLVSTAQPSGNFQKTILKIGDFLLLLDVLISIVIIVFGVVRHEHFLEILQFCLVLAIASVPIALPTVLSVCLAVGSRELAQKQAIVTRLSAVEELASCTHLCSDKTGTLTKNEITVDKVVPLSRRYSQAVREFAVLASSWSGKEVMDKAVLEGVDTDAIGEQFEQVEFTPFGPKRKRAECLCENLKTHERFYVAKNAPQAVLALLKEEERDRVAAAYNRRVEKYAANGFRCLSVAVRADDQAAEWRLAGLLTLLDPPRDDSAEVCQRLMSEYGVDVKMITGDQTIIGIETARRLGMGTHFMSAAELRTCNQREIQRKIQSVNGFGECMPAEKYVIVEEMQDAGFLVAMTGDGVNDAPALKKANVGFAVQGATDAARNAASVVLLESGLSVILTAIGVSRQIFSRMMAYVYYRVATTLHMLLFMSAAILAYDFYLPPLLIVLITLMNDVSIISIAYDSAPVHTSKPSKWRLAQLFGTSSAIGICLTAATDLLLVYARTHGYTEDEQKTAIYLNISVSGHIVVFGTRVQGNSFVARQVSPFFAFAILGTQVIASVLAAEGWLMDPLGWTDTGYVWVYSLVWFLFIDVVKQLTETATGEDTSIIKESPFVSRHAVALDQNIVRRPSFSALGEATGASSPRKSPISLGNRDVKIEMPRFGLDSQ